MRSSVCLGTATRKGRAAEPGVSAMSCRAAAAQINWSRERRDVMASYYTAVLLCRELHDCAAQTRDLDPSLDGPGVLRAVRDVVRLRDRADVLRLPVGARRRTPGAGRGHRRVAHSAFARTSLREARSE